MTANDLTRWAILLMSGSIILLLSMWGSIILLLKWKRGRRYVGRIASRHTTIGHAYHHGRSRKAARFKSPADQSDGD